RDEDDRERVRDRPHEERDVPQQVALREIDVPLDDSAEADELVAKRECELTHQPNTSRCSSSSCSSSSKARPVAAKNASSSVSTPNRRFTSSTGSRKSSSPRSR